MAALRTRVASHSGAMALVLITLLALALRIRSFGDSLNGDELATYFVVTGHGVGRIVDIVQSAQEVTPPLFPVLAHFTAGLGSSTDGLRWIPLAAGVGAIPLTYLLGLRTVGREAGLVAAAVMALSPFLIFYSSEARPYSLMMLFCLVSSLALLRALGGDGRRWWAVYGAASAAAMWTHYTALFVLFGQFAWALSVHRSAWKPLFLTNVAAALAFAPWLTSYQADQDSPGANLIGFLQPFGLGTLKTDVMHWAFGHPAIDSSVKTMPGTVALVLMAAGLLLGGVLLLMRLAPRLRERGWVSHPTTLVVVLALSTPVIAAVYSAVSVSVFLPRNLIASWPGLALVMGAIVTAAPRRELRVAATVLLISGFAIGAGKMQRAESQRPDYKSVAEFIEQRGGSDPVVVDVPGLSPGPLSQLDATIAPGQAMPTGEPVLRLGRPPRADQLRAARPGGPGQFAPLPTPAAATIAAQARRRAAGKPIFLVTPGAGSIALLSGRQGSPATRAFFLSTETGRFLNGLPGYREAARRTYEGFFGTGTTSVYVLER